MELLSSLWYADVILVGAFGLSGLSVGFLCYFFCRVRGSSGPFLVPFLGVWINFGISFGVISKVRFVKNGVLPAWKHIFESLQAFRCFFAVGGHFKN